MRDERPGWDAYFFCIATAVALRGDCARDQVGAVLVDTEHRIVSTGYNGAPAGGASCLGGDCPRGRLDYDEQPAGGSYGSCIALHAEWNAIAHAGRDRAQGSTLYVTREPCPACLSVISDAGVEMVHWLEDEGDDE